MSFKNTGKIIDQKKNFNVRSGVIAKKEGMLSFWNAETSTYIPATLLKIDNIVSDKKNIEKHGYNSYVLAYGDRKKINKPLAGNLKLIQKLDISSEDNKSEKKDNWNDIKHQKYSYANLKEFRSNMLEILNIGDKINASYFKVGQFIDATGITLGKGFAGGMKRWNFRGLEASHGVSVSHRSSGSTGQRQDPGRTFQGKKMPGHMGDKQCTIQNLEVLAHASYDPSVLIVKGSVPGYNGSFIIIKDSVKE
ncbi:MAG: 50S ribosomal protein L3 [Rickettsiales bacterium]